MENTLYIVFIVLLLIVVGSLIIYTIFLSTTYVQPSQCPQTTGNFGVQPSMNGLALNTCGITKDQPCIYPSTSTLGLAMNICSAQLDCVSFSYNATTDTMTVIDPNTALFPEPGVDIYTRQNPAVIKQT